ncbi:integrase, catalytic region, zinc finger, CCHC-type containing protein [Tanacetum coccineum]
MILESVEHGPLIWPTIEENGVTRTKIYVELFATEKIQADCDLKETNIILQGLPYDIYSLVNHHKVARDLWERIQLLMQVNTKFLNSLPPEWSKFVTAIKLVKDFHTTNFDQLHSYFQQNELHANEVRIMRERNHDPLALVADHQQTPSHFNTYQSFSSRCLPTTIIHSSNWIYSLHSKSTNTFKQGDDHIDAINKMMSFLSTVITSRFPSTNNQLRNSSNPRQQATIHDARVTIPPVQGRQTSFDAGMSGTRANVSGTGGNNSGQQRVMKCFNCQGEGHMARQCPKLKRKRVATWFRDKVLLVKAHGNGKVLNEEELEFLADLGILQKAKAVLMANLSSYGSDYLLETQNTNVQDTNSSAQQDAMILSVFEQLSNQETDIQEKNKKKAKSKQFQARSRKGQSQKSDKARKYNFGGPKLPKPQVVLQKRKTRVKIAKKVEIAFKLYNLRGPFLPTPQKVFFPVQRPQAPTEGYEDAIVVPEIEAANFEIKHGLLTLVQNKQFFGNEKRGIPPHLPTSITSIKSPLL